MLGEDGKEAIMVRFNGGPQPGARSMSIDNVGWPPPETVEVGEQPNETGFYRRTGFSDMPPVVEGEGSEHLVRGADYEWVERE